MIEQTTAMTPVSCDPYDEQYAIDPLGQLLVRDESGSWVVAQRRS